MQLNHNLIKYYAIDSGVASWYRWLSQLTSEAENHIFSDSRG